MIRRKEGEVTKYSNAYFNVVYEPYFAKPGSYQDHNWTLDLLHHLQTLLFHNLSPTKTIWNLLLNSADTCLDNE